MHTGRRCSIALAPASAALLLMLSALPASAQMLRGRVVAAGSEKPVTEAAILIFAGGSLIGGVDSDSLGNFEIALPAAGEYTLTANRTGFIGIGPATFTVPTDRVLDVVLTMSDAVMVLDPLAVDVIAVPRTSIERARFRSAENRKLGVGVHLNRAEIRKSQRQETGDLLTTMTPQVRYGDIRPPMTANGRGGYSPVQGHLPKRLIGVTRMGRFCPLALFVDGVTAGRGDTAVLPHPNEIETIEVYVGTQIQDGFYDHGGCGFALVTTSAPESEPRYRRTLLGSSVLAAMLGIIILAN